MTKWSLSLFSNNPSRPDSTKSVPLQILSDIHLEATNAYETFSIPPCSPYLILAGDVGRLIDYDAYLSFLQRQTAQFERVFLVLGNHEFCDKSFEESIKKAQQLASEPALNGRLILLHRGRYDIPDSNVTILGCTLWSSIADDKAEGIRYKVQDFQKIQDWSIQAHNEAHRQDLSWLKDQVRRVREEGDRKIVVITHHAPMTKQTSAPQHKDSPVASAFGSDLLASRKMKEWEGVQLWVYGHTHFSTDFEKSGIRVVSNQRGYAMPWMDNDKGFNAEKVVHVA
ncbi:putative calcineurin-like phosphoesterase [Aspergillus pseudoustus]|uniref:Calcineurin-like phosphoesterase n=1 Tax=Aspergillus pseudoustus TaxID=1810923 RepID=A0ABR4KBR8_9EURO